MKEVNPDLFFNRATVFEYLERYNEATSDFAKAHVIDPNLGGEHRSEQIIRFVSMAYNAISNKGRLKTNKISDMVKSIPQKFENANVVKISELVNGENPGMMISSKVVNCLEKNSDVPMCFLCVDHKHNFFVASIYHTSKQLTDLIRSGSAILIKNPMLVLIQLNFKGYQYNYQCIKITDINTVLVNGKSL